MNPTKEQLHCVSTAKANQRTKINAVAGAGKTSTLVLMANESVREAIGRFKPQQTALQAA